MTRSRTLERDPSLDDQIRPCHRRLRFRKKVTEKGSRAAKWDVPEDPEPLRWKSQTKEVARDYKHILVLREPSNETNGEPSIDLDGNDLLGKAAQLPGQYAVARSDLDYQVQGRHAGAPYDGRGEALAPKGVLSEPAS